MVSVVLLAYKLFDTTNYAHMSFFMVMTPLLFS